MSKPLRVLVTSGGTREKVDDVRVLTNISTGKLGAKIASLIKKDTTCEVTYLHSRDAELPKNKVDVLFVQADSTQDVFEAMKELVPQNDIVIHAMAVSDFGFRQDVPVKLKSNDPAGFIESLRQRIVVNPKIIGHVKQWNPLCYLVGFKFEVGQTVEQLIAIARESLFRNSADIVVANDKEMMKQEQRHIAYIVTADGVKARYDSKIAIAMGLVDWIKALPEYEDR